VDVKIKGLDDELRKFNLQLKKATGSAATMLKKRAMDTLKRKKMYEQQRDQLSGQMFNIDQTNFAIETVKSTQITVSAMKEANKQLKIENKKINLSEIEDMQDDLEGKLSFSHSFTHTNPMTFASLDQLEDAGEISDLLARSYGTPNDIDEDDLEAELACLGDEFESIGVEDESPAYLSAAPTTAPASNVSLPEQPTSSIATTTTTTKLDAYGLPI
jgi:charged multivesicular body protein 5